MGEPEENVNCCSHQDHQGHLCELESQQEWEILRQVTDRPSVRCENCGGAANTAGNVCMPQNL
jgi:hypothetical protein